MVIIVSREGQLANRILHLSNFLVNAKAHNYKIKHIYFDDYYQFFSERLNRGNIPVSFFGKKKTWPVTFFQRLTALFVKGLIKFKITRLPFLEIINYGGYDQESTPFNLNNPDYLRKAKSKFVLVYGWLFRDSINPIKFKQLLLDTWEPNNNFRKNIERYYNRYRKNRNVLVGVHVRRGDYKKFEEGKWFYTTEQYFEKIKEVAALKIFEAKEIAFVICSNEKNISFPHSGNITILNEERHFIEDIYLLAKCDYIIGPPSTFTMWASFYGEVPLLMLKDISKKIDEDFFDKQAKVYH